MTRPRARRRSRACRRGRGAPAAHGCTRRRREPAFSLVELVVVAAIISVLATIVVPRFGNSIVRQRADAAVRRITSDLLLAQRRARADSAALRVSFNVVASGYQLIGLSDPDHSAQPYVVNLAGEPYAARVVSVNFGGDADIIFDGYGRPDSGGTITIQVGHIRRTITLDAETATTTVSESIVMLPARSAAPRPPAGVPGADRTRVLARFAGDAPRPSLEGAAAPGVLT